MDRILNFHKATIKSEIGLKIISYHRHANCCYEYLHKPSINLWTSTKHSHLPNMVQWIGYFQQHTRMEPWWTSFFHEVFWDQLCAFHYSVVGCFVCWSKPQTVLCTIVGFIYPVILSSVFLVASPIYSGYSSYCTMGLVWTRTVNLYLYPTGFV